MDLAPEQLADTRQRLLQAAGEVFAEQGFRQATVRDIIERAGANIAAVNYHFRDKLGLYNAALQHWVGAAYDRYPADGGLPPRAPARQRLTAFIRAFLFRLLDSGVPSWHGQLMAREMSDPTPGVLERLIDSHIRPHSQLLFGIVRELIGPAAGEDELRLCAFSIVGQCLFYRHCESMLRLMAPGLKFDAANIEKIAAHVAEFSLSALRARRAERVRAARRRRTAAASRERS